MRKLLSTLALTALIVGMASGAEAREGWYVRGDVGYSIEAELNTSFEIEDEEPDSSTARQGPEGPQALIVSQSFDLENGMMGDIGGGYNFGNGFRAEAELAYRNNDIDGVSFTDVEARSLMINGFFDFNRDGAFQPYVGAGVGYANLEVEDEDDANWAWQAMAGVGIPLDENTTFDIAYRFFSVEDVSIGIADVEHEHQAITAGLRYQFGAPAAAPVTPPQPQPQPQPQPTSGACPTSEFTVYFEWDRSSLNAEAMQVIDQAVTRARQCNVNAVAIVGHTDTSGSPAYNVGLSERRAGVVRDALVARGLTASTMATQARGESEPARQTGDGVREPLNRRTAVTITFR